MSNRSVRSAVFSRDGKQLLTSGEDKEVQLWDINSNDWTGPAIRFNSAIGAAAFSPDEKQCLVATDDGAVHICDLRSGKEVTSFWLLNENKTDSVGYDPTGDNILAFGKGSFQIIYTGDLRWSVPPLSLPGRIRSAAFSPDGTKIVTAGDDSAAQLWDRATLKSIGPPLHHHGPVSGAGFSPDGHLVVTASLDGTAQIWDPRTAKTICPPLRHKGAVLKAAFLSDGKTVFTVSDSGIVNFWSTKTGQLSDDMSPFWYRSLTNRQLNSLSLSSDEKTFLTACSDSSIGV
ncbi:MAG TPA: hypothetical protein VGN00_12740 [Puia sp.]|jgi:WD40 repeat protein